MTTVERHTTASPQAVWAVLADPWTYPGWVVGASRIRSVDGTWPERGATIHHSVGTWPLLINDTTTVVESTPGERLVLQARAWPMGEATVEITVAGADDGSTIRMFEQANAGPGRLIPKAVQDLPLRQRNHESLLRLALIAEGHDSGPDAALREAAPED